MVDSRQATYDVIDVIEPILVHLQPGALEPLRTEYRRKLSFRTM